MSEPTDGVNQGPGPDQGQNQAAGSDFSDPTAPVWAEPTAPLTPMPPESQASPAPQAPQTPPMTQAPQAGYYGQQPGQQYPAYGQQPGQQYPAYGQQPYVNEAPSESNVSAIILTIVSALAMLSTCVVGIPSLIFGIVALTSNSTDPLGSRQKAKTGWIVFAVNAVIGIGIIVGLFFLVGNFLWLTNQTTSNFPTSP